MSSHSGSRLTGTARSPSKNRGAQSSQRPAPAVATSTPSIPGLGKAQSTPPGPTRRKSVPARPQPDRDTATPSRDRSRLQGDRDAATPSRDRSRLQGDRDTATPSRDRSRLQGDRDAATSVHSRSHLRLQANRGTSSTNRDRLTPRSQGVRDTATPVSNRDRVKRASGITAGTAAHSRDHKSSPGLRNQREVGENARARVAGRGAARDGQKSGKGATPSLDVSQASGRGARAPGREGTKGVISPGGDREEAALALPEPQAEGEQAWRGDLGNSALVGGEERESELLGVPWQDIPREQEGQDALPLEPHQREEGTLPRELDEVEDRVFLIAPEEVEQASFTAPQDEQAASEPAEDRALPEGQESLVRPEREQVLFRESEEQDLPREPEEEQGLVEPREPEEEQDILRGLEKEKEPEREQELAVPNLPREPEEQEPEREQELAGPNLPREPEEQESEREQEPEEVRELPRDPEELEPEEEPEPPEEQLDIPREPQEQESEEEEEEQEIFEVEEVYEVQEVFEVQELPREAEPEDRGWAVGAVGMAGWPEDYSPRYLPVKHTPARYLADWVWRKSPWQTMEGGDGETTQAAASAQAESRTLKDENNFIQNVSQFFNQEDISDVVLKVGERKFFGHKFVLAKSSEVFRTMLYDKRWQQAGLPEIDLEESEECQQHFEPFLRFLYTAEVQICTDSAVGILCLADKYSVMSLKTLCTRYMVDNTQSPKVRNALNWYSWAKALHMEELIDSCTKTISWNMEQLFALPEWLDMDIDFVADILSNPQLVVSNEFTLYHALERWLLCDHHAADLLNNSKRLLPLVRFPQMMVQQVYKVETGELAKREGSKDLIEQLLNKAYRFRSLCPFQADLNITFDEEFYRPRNYKDLTVDTVRMQNTLRFGIQVDVRTYVGPVPSTVREGEWKITYRKSNDSWTLQVYCHDSALVNGEARIQVVLVISDDDDRVLQVEASDETVCSRGNHLTMVITLPANNEAKLMTVLIKPLPN